MSQQVGTRMRVIDRQLSDQPPLGANGVVQPGGELYAAYHPTPLGMRGGVHLEGPGPV